MLILIVSLLCEHCDFDHLNEQREGTYELHSAKWVTLNRSHMGQT